MKVCWYAFHVCFLLSPPLWTTLGNKVIECRSERDSSPPSSSVLQRTVWMHCDSKSQKHTRLNTWRGDVQLINILFLFLPLSSCRCFQVSGINPSMSRKREQRVLFMVVVMVICYLLCWLPYGIMALLATFGPPGLVNAGGEHHPLGPG